MECVSCTFNTEKCQLEKARKRAEAMQSKVVTLIVKYTRKKEKFFI